MVKRLEQRLHRAGMTVLDRNMAIGFYLFYVAWFLIRIFTRVPPETFNLILIYSDIMNILLCSTGFVLAVRHHFWLERVAAQLIALNTAGQLVVYLLFLNGQLHLFNAVHILLAVIFTFYFNMRAFGLTVRITKAQADVIVKLVTPGEPHD